MDALQGVKMVIADPLHEPICPQNAAFIPLPAESFSGRIYRNSIPNQIAGFEKQFGGIGNETNEKIIGCNFEVAAYII